MLLFLFRPLVSDDPMRRTPCLALAATLALTACAPARPPPPLPPRPMERSSVDVLLRNRGELELTDEQVRRLELLDEQRETQAAAVRAQLAERRRAQEEKAAERPSDIGTGSGRTPGAAGPPHGMGSSAGPSTRGGRTPPLGGRRDEGLARLRQKLDDLDSRAYADAVTEVLSPGVQRDKAEKLASAYREALFDYREAVRRRGGPPED